MSAQGEHVQDELDRLLARGSVDATAAVELLIRRALAMGASDLILEPRADRFEVNVRLDGVIVPLAGGPREALPNVVNRIKVLAGLLTYRHDLPQEGRIPANSFGADLDFRAAIYPTPHGDRVAVRVFDSSHKDIELADLGLPGDILDLLSAAAARPEGVILLTGPAGSGKTTTIYALLRHMRRTDAARRAQRSIITIEDPIEMALEGVTQTTVNEAAGLDFARALRSLLRQDPNVIVVGEIRDRETARAAIAAGLSGHLVISTIHAGSTCGVFSRLLDMGIEPYQVTGAVAAVLAQRLPRRLCAACAGSGCDRCRRTGFSGRLLLAEYVSMGPELAEGIRRHVRRQDLQQVALQQGMVTLAQRGRLAVQAGLTTGEEVDRVLADQ
ncbi:MAG: type II/IV secretion system protein [Planctomycetes bacterium]|nr:type II/IV secretion system protein [Planctomycetota bacterium]